MVCWQLLNVGLVQLDCFVSVEVVIEELVVVGLRAYFGKAWQCFTELDQEIVSLEVLTLMEFFLVVVWLTYLSDSAWWLQVFGQEFLGHSILVGSVVGSVVVLHVSLEQPMVWLGTRI
jgi:hypothetical protein